MRTFYSYTDLTMIECLSNREILGQSIRDMHNLKPDEHFSVDIFNESGLLLTHFEYP